MCLSYPQIAHLKGTLDSLKILSAAFLIEDLALCQFFLLTNKSPLVWLLTYLICLILGGSIPKFLHLLIIFSFKFEAKVF